MSLSRIHIISCIRRYISTSVVNHGKALKREGKFMKKMIYGEIPKKKWFPAKDSKSLPIINTAVEHFTSPHVTRRVIVRNKLFMKHITDLMATGEVANAILGRGIEVSRVNITNDFKLVKVFWLSTTTNSDELDAISDILKECAYKLRHELSQLKVIGVVPPIQFFKDQQLQNALALDKCLLMADYGDDYTPSIKISPQSQLTLFTKLPDDVREKIMNHHTDEELDDEEESEKYNVDLPSMRHDVLGLDHFKIMSNVKQSLKKSAEAAVNRRENLLTEEKQLPFVPPQINSLRTEEETAAFNAFLLSRQIEEKKRRQLTKEAIAQNSDLETQFTIEDVDEIDVDDIASFPDYCDDNDDDDDIPHVNN